MESYDKNSEYQARSNKKNYQMPYVRGSEKSSVQPSMATEFITQHHMIQKLPQTRNDDEMTEFTMQQDQSQRIGYDMVSMQGSEFQSYHGMTGKVSIDYARDDDTEGDTVFGNQSEVRRQAEV